MKTKKPKTIYVNALNPSVEVGSKRIVNKFLLIPRCINGLWAIGPAFAHQEFIEYTVHCPEMKPYKNWKWSTYKITKWI